MNDLNIYINKTDIKKIVSVRSENDSHIMFNELNHVDLKQLSTQIRVLEKETFNRNYLKFTTEDMIQIDSLPFKVNDQIVLKEIVIPNPKYIRTITYLDENSYAFTENGRTLTGSLSDLKKYKHLNQLKEIQNNSANKTTKFNSELDNLLTTSLEDAILKTYNLGLEVLEVKNNNIKNTLTELLKIPTGQFNDFCKFALRNNIPVSLNEEQKAIFEYNKIPLKISGSEEIAIGWGMTERPKTVNQYTIAYFSKKDIKEAITKSLLKGVDNL